MPIKLTNLTAGQTNALDRIVKSKTTDFVVSTGTTTAVLNGTVTQALAAIQSVMDEIRETEGSSGTGYRPLVAVRNKLEAAKGKGSKEVVVIPNGANVAGDVPDVLNGAPVTADARADVQEPEATEAPSVLDGVPDIFDIGRVRENWNYMLRNAPNLSAAHYWTRKLESLPS